MPRRNRFAAWYERTPRPGLALVAVVVVFYAPSLFTDFMLDDHRMLRVLRDYRDGQRDSPMVYDFLAGDARNAVEREAGLYPWWMADGLKYRHLRPTASWMLYGEYRLFGERAMGFRAVGVALYAIGVVLMLRVFRLVSGDERVARWAALVFALAASHVIPVVFISAHCDLIALVAAGGVLTLTGEFVRRGGAGRLVGAAVLLLIGLGAKEAMLPVTIAPALWWLTLRRRTGASSELTRRTRIATALMLAIGITWLAYYTRGGYGSNTLAMMDPLRHSREYLAALPSRAVLLLGTWLVPLNPFLLEIIEGGRRWLTPLMWFDLAALLVVAALFLRRWRRVPGVGVMAVWPVMFLPILACTPPDDRVMILPSIGLAYLSAVWLTGRHGTVKQNGSAASMQASSELLVGDGDAQPVRDSRLLRTPLVLFIGLQLLTGAVNIAAAPFTEWEAQRNLRVMADALNSDRASSGPAEPARQNQPWIIVLNARRMVEPLFMQDRFHRVIGPGRVAVLCDVGDPKVTRVDGFTLRIEATNTPLLTTYLGRMGTPRGRSRQLGDVLGAGEYEARVVAVRDGEVQAVEIRFREPLDSEKYRFWWSEPAGPPRRWSPSAPQSASP